MSKLKEFLDSEKKNIDLLIKHHSNQKVREEDADAWYEIKKQLDERKILIDRAMLLFDGKKTDYNDSPLSNGGIYKHTDGFSYQIIVHSYDAISGQVLVTYRNADRSFGDAFYTTPLESFLKYRYEN